MLVQPSTPKVCDTDNCIGYSYAPCERICTLHGEPELFRGLPLPERWSTLNGSGNNLERGQFGTNRTIPVLDYKSYCIRLTWLWKH